MSGGLPIATAARARPSVSRRRRALRGPWSPLPFTCSTAHPSTCMPLVAHALPRPRGEPSPVLLIDDGPERVRLLDPAALPHGTRVLTPERLVASVTGGGAAARPPVPADPDVAPRAAASRPRAGPDPVAGRLPSGDRHREDRRGRPGHRHDRPGAAGRGHLAGRWLAAGLAGRRRPRWTTSPPWSPGPGAQGTGRPGQGAVAEPTRRGRGVGPCWSASTRCPASCATRLSAASAAHQLPELPDELHRLPRQSRGEPPPERARVAGGAVPQPAGLADQTLLEVVGVRRQQRPLGELQVTAAPVQRTDSSSRPA